ncbi:MAG TPA: electron transfer flavoprotein subunit beta/FixA family protein [Nitrolancea sp.]|nr:electron transfer flavoprotein subunit beta/FixA family protein [Nitrolancea sp.]
MNIAVLVKQVPDPNAVRLDRRSGDILPGTPLVPNEYDLVAAEAAVRLSETFENVQIVAVAAGNARETLNRCLAMGVDRAVVLATPSSALDSLGTARVLASWLKQETFDLILTGQEASDGGTGNVAPQLAALLGLPLVSNVIGLEYQNDALTLKREIEDGHQVVTVQTPAVLSVLTALNEARHPTLKGIMASRRKPTETHSADISPEELAPVVRWGSLFADEQTAAGVMVRDEAPDVLVDKLMAFLEERKLIEPA